MNTVVSIILLENTNLRVMVPVKVEVMFKNDPNLEPCNV